MGNILTIFLTGLLTGGLTCMAVQGGLLAATLAQAEEEKLEEKTKEGNALPIVSFLISKLFAYTLLGFLLGMLGGFFSLSIQVRAILQIAVAIFMIGTACNILNIHPIFRYFVIQPPKFLTKLVRKQSKSKSLFAPAILGAFTIFIPCGTTQAMMALAIASGKPIIGATIMFAFILGTSPVFFILGFLATKLADSFQARFMKLASFAIILLAIFNLNNASALLGSKITLENAGLAIKNFEKNFWCTVSWCRPDEVTTQVSQNAMQNPGISITSNGYNPNYITIKKGSKVNITLTNVSGQGCIQAFTIPALGIQKIVPVGTKNVIAFTVPNQAGEIPFMCSMGMYRGVIKII